MQQLLLAPQTLRHLLVSRRLMQKQVAPALGVSESRLSRILHGQSAVQQGEMFEAAKAALCKDAQEAEQLAFALRHDEALWALSASSLSAEEVEGISLILRAMRKLDERSRTGLVANLKEVAEHRNLVERLASI